MNRRRFLRGLAAAPAVGQVALKEVAAKVAGSTIAPLSNVEGYANSAPSVSDAAPLKLTSFLKYALKRESDWRNQAKHVTALDPDLLSMHLPLTTLFRWQRERNYERIKAEEELNFKNIVKQHGHFTWWG